MSEKTIATESALGLNEASERSMMIAYQAHRRRLPDTRRAVVHRFRIGEHEGYIRVGLFDDGRPGEVFVDMNKAGSTMSGLVDSLAIMASLALQSGVPLEVIAAKFQGQKFQPCGYTANAAIPYADSVPDYVFRWMLMTFSDPHRDKVQQADLLLPAPTCADAGQHLETPVGSETIGAT